MPTPPRKPQACPTCGVIFTAKRREQFYCSRQCIKPPGKNLLVCPCGTTTGSYSKKYCCDEHREQWGRKKAPLETVNHVCQQCHQTFTRPWNYPGKKMFCSVDCSNKQHSRKRAQHWRFGNLTLNGSYELRFIACLERLSIAWEPWPDDKCLWYFVNDDRHTYTPDFKVNGMAIEVKGIDYPGSFQPVARDAWNSCPLIVVDEKRLGQLEHIFSQSTFIGTLSDMKPILKQAEQPENVDTVEAVLDGVNNGDQVSNPTVVAGTVAE